MGRQAQQRMSYRLLVYPLQLPILARSSSAGTMGPELKGYLRPRVYRHLES